MRNMVETVLRWLGILRGQEIYYIGGSDILPPPLKGQEEQSALQAMEQGDERAKQRLIAQPSAGGIHRPPIREYRREPGGSDFNRNHWAD